MSQPAPPTNKRVQTFAPNPNGRDFCVGDIHGMFKMLERLLAKARFNPKQDRLFSVGDLIDRGPDSLSAIKFLRQPWFHAIRGNHEAMLITCRQNPDDLATAKIWLRNGGEWWLDTTADEREAMFEAVAPLPLVMEIETGSRRVGIVHADIPPSISWQQFLAQITAGDPEVEATALWSRTRANLYKIVGDVPGIERIVCGHNIVEKPLMAGNVSYIDTGAYMPKVGRMTMVEISDAEEPSFSITAAELS